MGEPHEISEGAERDAMGVRAYLQHCALPSLGGGGGALMICAEHVSGRMIFVVEFSTQRIDDEQTVYHMGHELTGMSRCQTHPGLRVVCARGK